MEGEAGHDLERMNYLLLFLVTAVPAATECGTSNTIEVSSHEVMSYFVNLDHLPCLRYMVPLELAKPLSIVRRRLVPRVIADQVS